MPKKKTKKAPARKASAASPTMKSKSASASAKWSLDFDFGKFFTDTLTLLTGPRTYFSKMKKRGGYVRPVIKAALYGLIAGLLSVVLLYAFSSAQAFIIQPLFMAPVFAVIVAFIGSVILHFVALLCKGDAAYEDTAEASASLLVVYPAYMVISFFLTVNIPVMIGLLAVLSLYMIYLFYNAVAYGLGGKKVGAQTISITFAILALLYWGHIIYMAHHPLGRMTQTSEAMAPTASSPAVRMMAPAPAPVQPVIITEPMAAPAPMQIQVQPAH